MEKNRDGIFGIEKVLAAVHRRKSGVSMSAGLRHDTIRRIRMLPRPEDDAAEYPDSRMLFRFAVTACFAAAIIFIYAFQSDLSTDYEVVKLLGDDFLIASALGLL